MSTSQTARNYCFTINNPQQLEDGSYKQPHFHEHKELIRYAIYQLEQGESGTTHWQGYMELAKPQRITAIKKIAGMETAHLEPRRGTRDQARDYCRKTEGRLLEPIEYGSWKAGGSGARNDVTALKEMIDEGKSDLEIWDSLPKEFLRFNRAIKEVRRLKTAVRTWATEVIVCVGRPGCGKSKYALDLGEEQYWKQRSQWWDDYTGQHTVVLDEYYGWLPIDTMLRVLDRYPLLVEVKGGQAQFTSKRVVITTNKWPVNWYKAWRQNTMPFEAFSRRVTKWVYWDTDGERQEFTGTDSYNQFKECADNDGFDTAINSNFTIE